MFTVPDLLSHRPGLFLDTMYLVCSWYIVAIPGVSRANRHAVISTLHSRACACLYETVLLMFFSLVFFFFNRRPESRFAASCSWPLLRTVVTAE